MKIIIFTLFIILSLLTLGSCSNDDDYTILEAEEGEAFSGGALTIFDVSQNAFDFQAPTLDGDIYRKFFI